MGKPAEKGGSADTGPSNHMPAVLFFAACERGMAFATP
jgi:hypothetical protein